MKKFFILFVFIILFSVNVEAATYYVRTDGGPGGNDSTHCNGQTDAAFTGSNGPACAFNHINWPLPYQNSHSYDANPSTYAMSGGDTLVIVNGPVRMGCPNDTSNCIDADTNHTSDIDSSTYVAGDMQPPSGSESNYTTIIGCTVDGCTDPDDRPELYLVGRMDYLFNLSDKHHIKFQDLEITDHWGNDGECGYGFTVQPCGRAAFYSDSSDWHDLTFDGMDIHGLTECGFGKWAGPGANGSNVNWIVTDTNIDGNKSAGIDMDNCDNDGTCGITGDITFTNVNMRWNGCSEAYPVVWGEDGVNGVDGRLPTAQSCREGSNGGYGDMIGSSDFGGDWTFIGGSYSHNTSDAWDFLYCGRTDNEDYGECNLTIKRVIAEGNNGQVVKGPEPYVEDSLIIGNCDFWSSSTVDYTASGFIPCRALGTPIMIQYRASPAQTAKFINNTIYSSGDVMFFEEGTHCNLEIKNNILIGARDFGGSSEDTAMYYDESCGTEHNLDEDYNICNDGFKTGSAQCSNTNDLWDTDPEFIGAVLDYLGWSDYYSGTDFYTLFSLSSSSPAIAAADHTIAVADEYDRDGIDRGIAWDMGALEYEEDATVHRAILISKLFSLQKRK